MWVYDIMKLEKLGKEKQNMYRKFKFVYKFLNENNFDMKRCIRRGPTRFYLSYPDLTKWSRWL